MDSLQTKPDMANVSMHDSIYPLITDIQIASEGHPMETNPSLGIGYNLEQYGPPDRALLQDYRFTSCVGPGKSYSVGDQDLWKL